VAKAMWSRNAFGWRSVRRSCNGSRTRPSDLIVTQLGGAHRAVAGVVDHDVDTFVSLQDSVQEATQFIGITDGKAFDDEPRTVRFDGISSVPSRQTVSIT
jgi:hypothetical protein